MNDSEGVEETEKVEKVGDEEESDVGTDISGNAEGGREGGEGREEGEGDRVKDDWNVVSEEENAGRLETEARVVIRLGSSFSSWLVVCLSCSLTSSGSQPGPLPDTELRTSLTLGPVPCTSPRSIGS